MKEKKTKIAIIKATINRAYTGTCWTSGHKFLCWDNKNKKTEKIVKKTSNEGYELIKVKIPLEEE